MRPVQLLGGERPDHLVRKRHRPQAPCAVGTLANGGVESIGPADNKGEVLQAANVQRFQVLRKGEGGVCGAAFIEQDEVVHPRMVEVPAEGLAFLGPYPSRVWFAGARFDVRHFDELESDVARQPVCVFVGRSPDPRGIRFADGDEGNLHAAKLRRPRAGVVYLRAMWTNRMTALIDLALDEDLGRGDHTTASSVPAGLQREGVIRAKEAGRVAGVEVALRVFATVDADLVCTVLRPDGAAIAPGDEVMRIRGAARSILMGERLALNFMQRMSGIATRTAEVVELLQGTP